MRLSVCLIARNEETNLPRALRSIEGICDEIVVADTGSTDRTREIAREFGARVIEFPWCDDFAAARNFTINHARGEWIFWLDADEELLQESRAASAASAPLLERNDVLGWHILRQDLVHADRPDEFTEMWQLRLFRRRADLRFRGRCHADFHPPLHETAQREGRTVGLSDVRIRHYGFIGALRPEKLKRAGKLLELELRDRPGQLYYLIEFARTLAALNDPRAAGVVDEATRSLLQHRTAPAAPTPAAALLLEYLLASPAAAGRNGLTPADVRALCDRWFPTAPPLLWSSARQLFEAGEFEPAAKLLERLVDLIDSNTYDRTVSFNPRTNSDDARLNLGVCYVRLAELDRAEIVFRRLLGSANLRPSAEQNLATIDVLRAR
jgi:hypothetical protein